MLHKQQLPDAEYKDLMRIFHFQVRLLLWMLCKADVIVLEKATIKQKFGEKVGKWLCGRIWRGADKTNFGNNITAFIELAKSDTGQAKASADAIWNDIQFLKKWERPNYGMIFPMLPNEWKITIYDVCIPFYESWLCGSGFKKSVFEIAADCIDRKRLMRAYRPYSNGVCSYCDGTLGDVGTTKEANECDHFFPKSKFPHLSLHPRNLFVSCKDCNQTWKADNAPMGVADLPGLYGTYHPQLRPGIESISVNVREEPTRTYKIELNDNNVAARAASLNEVLDLDCRWTNDINERLRPNLSELIAESVCTHRRNEPIDEATMTRIIDDVIDYKEKRIGVTSRAIREVAVLKYQRANQLAELMVC